MSGPTFLVIGAGFTGLSAALHLAGLRQAAGLPGRIVLLDGGQVASGPSGKSAGHIAGLQARDAAVRRICGEVLGDRLLAAAAEASHLVRALIERHAIECDLRDGYVTIHRDGRQSVSEGGLEFGIEAYPFALGLARAAVRLGVEIRCGVEVTALTPGARGVLATTSDGPISADFVLASGGHRMAEKISLLAPLRRRTTEIRVSTIITDPLPDAVLRAAMPAAAGRRFPFADESADVAYGSINSANRVVFGARATAWRNPDPAAIAGVLDSLLPALRPAFRAATGRDLTWQKLVVAEPLCFTRNLLPNVGAVAGQPNILYVHALGGHGIAIGTLLGRAAAEKLSALQCGDATTGLLFDAFAAVPHGWLPPWQPWRRAAGSLGLMLQRIRN